MSCNTCEKKACNNDDACSPRGDIDANGRIGALKRLEPWCSGTQCCTVGQTGCGGLLARLIQANLAGYRDGKLVVALEDGMPPVMFDTEAEFCDHVLGRGGYATFNRMRRDPLLSPTDVEAIAHAYAYEPISVGPELQADLYSPSAGWFSFDLGALGVSHKVCVLELTLTATDPADGPTLVTIDGVAIGGDVQVCMRETDAGTSNDTGAWRIVRERPRDWDPEEIDSTPQRCRCENLCVRVTARSGEHIYVHVPSVIPADNTLTLTGKVSRCDWLSLPASPTGVDAQGNRPSSPASVVGVPAALRDVPGSIPFL